MQSFAVVSFYFGQPRAATELYYGDFGFFGFSFSWFHCGSNFGSNPTDIKAKEMPKAKKEKAKVKGFESKGKEKGKEKGGKRPGKTPPPPPLQRNDPW